MVRCSAEVGWGPVGHAVVSKLVAKSGGGLQITVISEEIGGIFPVESRPLLDRRQFG